jgi:peptidoglycan/LPS O-acetylase OafA/YrhL
MWPMLWLMLLGAVLLLLLRLATTAGIKVAVEMRVSYDAPEWIFISTVRAVVRIFPSRNEEQECL